MKTAECIKTWNDWWLRLVPPHALAFCRIALGLFLLVYAGTYLPHISLLFSSKGIVLPLFAESLPAWIAQPPSPLIAWLIFSLLLVCIVCFTVGFAFRAATLGILLIALYEWQLQLHLFPTSYNRLLFFTLIIFLFSGADRAFSLRMKARKGSWLAWEPISILPQRILAVQLTATYLGVGAQKLLLPGWQSGEVLTRSFMGMWATPLAFSLSRLNLPIEFYNWLVHVVTALEIALPVLLWSRQWKWWGVAIGTMFHVLISVLLGIWWFMLLPPLYILFWPPETVYRWLKKKG